MRRLVAQEFRCPTQDPTDARVELPFQQRQQVMPDPIAQDGAL
jgi:hypothetical protein